MPSPPDEFYSVTLQRIIPEESAPQNPQTGVARVTFKIDKAIPNDSGRIEVAPGKDGAAGNRFDVDEYDPVNALRLSETDHLVVYFDPKYAPNGWKTPGDMRLPLATKVYLHHHRPLPATTNELIQKVESDLPLPH